MIKCKACGTEMSKKAPTCPKCGHPNKQANYLSGGQVLFGFAIAVAVIQWLASDGFGSGSSSKPVSTASASHPSATNGLPDVVFGWETLAQKAMGAALKDSDSAKYKSVHAYKMGTSKEKMAYSFCGLVNAKNGFGAQTGYKRFVAMAGTAALEGQTKDFSKVWALLCDPKNNVGAVAF